MKFTAIFNSEAGESLSRRAANRWPCQKSPSTKLARLDITENPGKGGETEGDDKLRAGVAPVYLGHGAATRHRDMMSPRCRNARVDEGRCSAAEIGLSAS